MARETVRIQGLQGVLEQLKALPPEIVSKAGGPVKFALRAAANLLRDEAKRNVRRIIDTPNVGGDDNSTGLLLLSIVSGRGKAPPGLKGERFSVRIRAGQRYPSNRGKDLTAAQIGRQLEYGTEHREPMPWLRPAFDAKKHEALQVFSTEMRKRTEAAIKKAERLARMKR